MAAALRAPRRAWTPAEDAQVRALYPNMRAQDVAEVIGRSTKAVYLRALALGVGKSEAFKASDLAARIRRGVAPGAVRHQFPKGLIPWNKGKSHRPSGRSAETQFKRGQKPQTWQPVGSLRVSNGVLERKENDLPGGQSVRWHPVHRTVWAAAYGPIPDGHLVVFKRGMRTAKLEEITADRLECITRAEHVRRNHPRNRDPELGRLIQLKGAIARQVNRIAREAHEKKS